jgi:transposase
MPIVPPSAPAGIARRRPRFRPVPWHDDHPDRLDLERLLPADHRARQIDAAVERLDLQPLRDRYRGCGAPAFPPELLLRVVLYETRCGYHSPGQWYRHACESAPVRWLLRGARPSRTAWYNFRDRVGPTLDALNAQPLAQAQQADLTPATRGAQDGTLVAANASRHRLLNAATLDQRAQRLEQAVAADDAQPRPQAVAADDAQPRPQAVAADAVPPSPPDPPGWMARQPAGRRRQQRRLAQARERLQQRHARNAAKRAGKRQKAERVVISPSDPEAALGRDKEKVYRPLYNVQVVDDLDAPFILGYAVFAQANDAGLLAAVQARVRQLLGHDLAVLLADTAYANGPDLAAAAAAGVTVYAPLPAEPRQGKYLPKSACRWDAATQSYVCPQEQRLAYERTVPQKHSGPEAVPLHRYRCPAEHCRSCPLAVRCTANPQAGRTVSRGAHEDLVEALRARMATAEAQALYQLRRQTVELANADWKAHRQLRRFSGRGLARACCQVGLLVLAHNLVTLLAEEAKAKARRAMAASTPENTT